MLRLGAPLVVGVFVISVLAGCVGDESGSGGEGGRGDPKRLGGTPGNASVFVGQYRFDGSYSYTLAAGPFAFSKETPLELGKKVEIPSAVALGSQTSNPWVVNNPNGMISMGLWLPDVPEGTKVPVIVDAGPYYDDGDTVAWKPANRLGKFLIENFVPHGYAVAQLSVRGSGNSGGCFDLMGLAEQKDLDAAITWLGTQEWSNGAVAMIGRSYDGSTPWEVAAQGNKYLKTIVPISGLSDFFGLMTHNGTSESRATGAIHGIYFVFPAQAQERTPENKAWMLACPEAYRGFATALTSTTTGDRGPAANDYYYVRDFEKFARQKWKGSVFMIHGFQDWNVEPHMGAPIADIMESEGYFVKQLWGQWGHMYPDRPSEHRNTACAAKNTRWDWAEIMLHWFDHELKGLTQVDTGPAVQLLDSTCRWHNDEHFPPHDAAWTTLHLSQGNKLTAEPGPAGSQLIAPTSMLPGENARSLPGYSVDFSTPPSETGFHFAGLPRLHITVTPSTPTGHVSGFLYDVGPDKKETRVGWTQMDIRYHAGGDTMQPVIAGAPILMKMEFEPLDVYIAPGHSLLLRLWETSYADHITSIPPGAVTLNYGGSSKSVLELPIITPDATDFFEPPQPPAGTKLNSATSPTSAPRPE